MILDHAKIDNIIHPLSYEFLEKLKYEIKRNNNIASSYYRLFALTDIEELETTLEVVKDEYIENTISDGDWWFTSFHKTLRQTDFFNGFYKDVEIPLITREENKKIKSFRTKLTIKIGDGFKKDDIVRDKGGKFTDEYKEILRLSELKKHQTRKEPISGHLDMLLWELIHLDSKGVLYDIMKTMFNKIRVKEKYA